MQDYRKLEVWQKAHALTLSLYAVVGRWRGPATWALAQQVREAAISIPSNIAEGCGRGSDMDFRRFLWHSLGSLNEVEYDLLLATDLEFLPVADHSRLTAALAQVRRMLSGLIARIDDDLAGRQGRYRGNPNGRLSHGAPRAGSWKPEAK